MRFHKILVIAAVVAGPVVAAAAEGTLASKHVGAMRGHGGAVAETVLETETETETGTAMESEIETETAADLGAAMDAEATLGPKRSLAKRGDKAAEAEIAVAVASKIQTTGNVSISKRFQPKNYHQFESAVVNWCTCDPSLDPEWTDCGRSGSSCCLYGDIESWDVTKMKDLSYAFAHMREDSCPGFEDVSLSEWNTAKVTKMDSMFRGNVYFNGDISKWNTAKVTSMSNMFQEASSFNVNIGKWKTSKVIYMREMFRDASGFDQALCWSRNKKLKTTNMWKGSMIGRWGTGTPGACF
jgi:surface protein